MNAENLTCNNRRNRQSVEGIHKCLPYFDIAAAFTLVVEPVDTSHVGAFVLPTKKEEVLWGAELLAQ